MQNPHARSAETLAVAHPWLVEGFFALVLTIVNVPLYSQASLVYL
jgi:hypothetical protein